MEGEVEKSDSVTKFRAAEEIFSKLEKVSMYEDENVEKKWHRIGFGRTWHSKIRTWKLVMSVPDWDRKNWSNIWRYCVFVWE